MKVFNVSEAKANLETILMLAQSEEVIIQSKEGAAFSVKSTATVSPFAVEGIRTDATTQDILDAVNASRMA